MPDFVGLLRRLTEAGVDYVLVGGLAAVAHGCSMVTQDVDICIRLGSENLERLQNALRDLEPAHRMVKPQLKFEHDREKLGTFKNVYLRTRLGQLDCLGEVVGVGGFAEVEKESVAIDLDGTPCRVISLDALIAAKSAMTRERDHLAAEQLRKIKALRKNS